MFNTQAPWNIGVTGVVTAGRQLDVTYTNNSGKTMFVMVNLDMQVNGLLDDADARIDVNGNTVASATIQALDATTTFREIRIITFFVPPGGTYIVANISTVPANLTLHRWVESY